MAKFGAQLSPRELEIVQLIAGGLSDKEIANELKISYGTVRDYVNRATIKYSAFNRTHLIAILKDLKII